MSALWKRRCLLLAAAAALVAGIVPLAGPKTAAACEEEEQVTLPVTFRAYDVPGGGRYIDGFVTNDTSGSVIPKRVRISFAEDSENVRDKWICSAPLAEGEWTTFHLEWPEGVSDSWTPELEGFGLPSETEPAALELTVTSVSTPTIGEGDRREYTVTVTNPNDFPVGDINLQGVEKDATSGDFVDTLLKCGCLSSIGASDSVELKVKGLSPWSGDVTTDVHVTALELPTVTLSVNTKWPKCDRSMAFTLRLMHFDGTPVTGYRRLKLLGSSNGRCWHVVDYAGTSSGVATVRAYPSRAIYYKAAYWDGRGLACATSKAIRVWPRKVVNPPSAPGRVKVRHKFRVRGRITAGNEGYSRRVKIIVKRWRHGYWRYYGKAYVPASCTGYYSKKLKLSKKGTYRIRVYRPGVGYTKYKKIRVR